jgi:hypothetical protein
VTNLCGEPFDILWGLHPAWSVTAGCRIDLPACQVEVRDSSPGNRLGEPGTIFGWPYATDRASGRRVDMREVGDRSPNRRFPFASDIPKMDPSPIHVGVGQDDFRPNFDPSGSTSSRRLARIPCGGGRGVDRTSGDPNRCHRPWQAANHPAWRAARGRNISRCAWRMT